MAGNFTPPPPKKNALSEYKVQLVGPTANGARFPASISISVVNNQPRLTVRTNVDGAKDYGRIMAKLDTPTFFAIIEAIDMARASQTEWKMAIKNMNHKWSKQNGRSSEMSLESTTWVGKDKDGVVFIAITAQDAPNLKFVFSPTTYHNCVHADGSAWTEAEVSMLYSGSFIRWAQGLTLQILHDEYVEPKPKGEKGNSGGGNNSGYNNNRNSNSGNSDYGNGGGNSGGGSGGGFDEEIPF